MAGLFLDVAAELEAHSRQHAVGAQPVYCQEAANPAVYKPIDVPQTYDVVFAGQCYGERADLVKWMRAQGIVRPDGIVDMLAPGRFVQ